MRNNSKSATEDQLGSLHSAVTGAFQRKLDLMLDAIKENPEDALFILDERAISAAGNWVLKNEISFAAPEQEATSPLRKSLEAIKERHSGKVIPFTDEEANG